MDGLNRTHALVATLGMPMLGAASNAQSVGDAAGHGTAAQL
jgi:hypothetical protein